MNDTVSTAQPAVHADSTSVGRVRWMIGGLLGFGAFVNYVDRVNLSIAAQPLAHSLHLSPSQLGIVFSAFLWTYALLQIPIGSVIDRLGVTWVMRIATVLWTLATFATAMAGGLGLLLVARLVLGTVEAPMIPAAWKATGYWFPQRERGTCTAILDGCAKLSNVLGIPVMAYIASRYGWRAVFEATAVLSAVYAVAFWLLYRDPLQMKSSGRLSEREYAGIVSGGAQPEHQRGELKVASVGALLRQRKTWGLAIGYATYTYSYYVLLTWMPSYLERQLGLNIMSSGIYASVPWIVAVLAELAIGGWLVDRLVKRGRNPTSVRRTVLVCSMLMSLAVLGAATTTSLPAVLAYMSVSAAGMAITAPTASSIVALIAPDGAVGKLGGIVNCVANLIGMAAPVVTGLIVETTGSFAAAFEICGALVAVGIVCYLFVLGPIEQMRDV
ncbi:MFS transporter [Burkholderia cenocepacia]|uniref:MFS transporter n=1 Tax=Burkholderia cenocepacia TaxID=95486 RepID=UPI001B93ECE1|nr:MFS transporter [Burkholderia cenocepacia]MBR8167996.1 MFS transporter [Burkholderia cenocepacia]